MKAFRNIAVVILMMGFFFISKAQNVQKNSTTADYESLAQKLVNQCGSIREGEMVLVYGGVNDLELLENIAVNIRKLGAFPLVTIGSDRMTRLMYTDVPAKYDSQAPDLDMKIFEFLDAVIAVNVNEAADLLADIPPERFIARGKAYEPVNELLEKRNVKGVNLGNGLYPTADQARQFGLTREELAGIFWKGVNTDYTKLEARGRSIKAILTSGKEVRITNPNGTDLKFRIESRPVFVSDGIISADDVLAGFAASQAYLPAGEVYVTPVAGTAEGKVMVDRFFYQGKEIAGLTLVFQQGKLTSLSARTGLEPLKAIYDAAETGKEEFAYFDMGINPDINIKPGSKMVAWMPAGMVTVGVGNNAWAGGQNNCTLGLPFFLPGSTVYIDGKVLVEKGVLKN
jgi:aminopeptidase